MQRKICMRRATFDEALHLEQRYSKHRDSDSFRAAEEKKQLKRKHPVNASEHAKSNLIDMTSMVSQIDKKQAELKTKFDAPNKYHSHCLEEAKGKSGKSTKKKPAIPVPRSNNLKRDNMVIESKKPRYENYLKSGKNVRNEKISLPPPPLMKMKKKDASATITKSQFLKQNGIDESEFKNMADASTPIIQPYIVDEIEDFSSKKNGILSQKFAKIDNQIIATNNIEKTGAINFVSNSDNFELGEATSNNVPIEIADRINIIDNIMIKPATMIPPNPLSESTGKEILSSLGEIKYLIKQSEEKRVRYEARMQTQWEVFVKKAMLAQGQNDGQAESINESEDFEDLDELFPIKNEPEVEELEWNVQRELTFKRRMKHRLDQLGGKDENQSIRLKMKYLIIDQVLEHYTWKGTGEKKAFVKLTFLNDLIFKSVRSQFPKYTFKAYKTYMVQWLKHSKTRQRTVVYHYPNRNERHENDEDDDDEDIE